VRHEIVHNTYVVNDLKAKGAIFIEDLADVPPGATLIFSAHGVSKAVRAEAAARGFQVFDATCPLVTKVHVEVAKLAKEGYEFIMIGHKGHPEVEGTMGQLTKASTWSRTWPTWPVQPRGDQARGGDADHAERGRRGRDPGRGEACFPHVREPKKQDICYATQNRQDAVKVLAPAVDVVIVVGSPTSSNSNRLRELAERLGTRPTWSTRRRPAARLVRRPAPRGRDGRRVGARHPGAAGHHAPARTGRGEHPQDGRRRGTRALPAAARPGRPQHGERRRPDLDAACTPAPAPF
jgi:hypothetical protein